MLYDLSKATGRLLGIKRKAASDIPDAALANAILGLLKCEINSSADHAKVIVGTVHKIPAEIADPANVRGHANFHAAADLADCPRLGTGLLSANDSVVHDNVRLFAATKDSAAAAKNVGRESRARDRVAQRQCAQHRTHGAALMPSVNVEDAVIKVDKNILKRASGIHCPAFNTDTEVPVEKVFEITTTAEGMIRLEVAIVLPIVACENISTPQTDVKLVVCVPLRTRWRRHLFHFLSGIGFPSNRCRSDCSYA
jgi:hypothetical protein